MVRLNVRQIVLPAAMSLMFAATPALAAGEHVEPAKQFASQTLAKWMSNPVVIEAIKAQNAKNSNLTESDIVALDKQWRAEVKASEHPLVDSLLKNELSAYLAKKKNGAAGLVTEIFVMDNKGLNVGQSDATSDYWQGDEAKWQKTYQQGPDVIFVDEVEKDASTQLYQSQVSMSIKDPATGEVIGAVTVGVNVDEL